MTTPTYTTTDPNLAAFLWNEGASLRGLRRLAPKRVEYAFTADAELHDLLRQYWGGDELPIVPSKLLATRHQLKCRSITRP